MCRTYTHRDALATTIYNGLINAISGCVRKEKTRNYRVAESLALRLETLADEAFRGRMSENALFEDCVEGMLALMETPPGQRAVPVLVKQVDSHRAPKTPLPENVPTETAVSFSVTTPAKSAQGAPVPGRSADVARGKKNSKPNPGSKSKQ